jgi:hypothetical protein
MIETKKSLFDNLQNFFGFDNFKGEQEAIITNIPAHRINEKPGRSVEGIWGFG